MSALSPEFRALCAVAAVAAGDGDPDDLDAALGRVGSWTDLVRGAVRHRIATMAQRILAGRPQGGVPQAVGHELEGLARRNALLGLSQLGELGRLMERFRMAGIRVLVVKGLVLSQRLYGDPFRRGVGDMDLLIDPAEFAAAHALLIGAGYRRQDTGTTRMPAAALLPVTKDVSYVRPPGQVVELHLRLGGEEDEAPLFDFSRLWEGRALVPVQGLTLPTLPDLPLAVYLVAHGGRHCWDRLCWLADLAVLFRDETLARSALAVCRELGLEREGDLARALMRDWLGVSPGSETGGPAGSPPRWFLEAFFSGRRWLERPPPGSLAWLARELRQRVWRFHQAGHWRRRRAALRRGLFNPVDQGIIPLPPGLSWLYPLLRPVGWLMRNFLRRRG